MTTPSRQLRHVFWPPERFLWVQMASTDRWFAGSRRRPAVFPVPLGLLDEVADGLPVPIDTVHAVAVLAGGDHHRVSARTDVGSEPLLVIAANKAELEALPTEVVSLGPESLPPGVGPMPGAVRLADINLLIGAYQPRRVRMARRRRHVLAMLAWTLLAGLVTLGLERRTQRFEGLAQSARDRDGSDRGEAGSGDAGSVDAVELEGRRAWLASIQSAAAQARRPDRPGQVPQLLAAILRAWPRERRSDDAAGAAPVTPQSMLISDAVVAITVRVPPPPEGDAAEFIRAWTPPPGWTLIEPRLVAQPDRSVQVALELRPGTTSGRAPSSHSGRVEDPSTHLASVPPPTPPLP